MDSKEIPVGSRQENTAELVKIKTGLKESLSALSPLLNRIEAALLEEDWKFIHDVEGPITESLEKIKQILNKDSKKYYPISGYVIGYQKIVNCPTCGAYCTYR